MSAERVFPPISELVPHAGAMRLLDAVLSHDPGETWCRVRSEDAGLFADAGAAVPAFVALEWMAQCIAVHGGLRARDEGLAPRAGLLLGTRRLSLHCRAFAAGGEYRVSARPRKEASQGLIAFGCAVTGPDGDTPLAEAQLNVYLLDPGAMDAGEPGAAGGGTD